MPSESNIVEYIGPNGILTSLMPYEKRLITPHPGDWIEFPDHLIKYPVSQKYCRITDVKVVNKSIIRLVIVDGNGSCFLYGNTSLSVSGGPFFGLFGIQIEPTYQMKLGEFWNWGNSLPGPGKGIVYHIKRPVFLAKSHPERFQARIAFDERTARNGGVFNNSIIPSSAKLFFASEPRRDGLIDFWFDLEPEEEPQE